MKNRKFILPIAVYLIITLVPIVAGLGYALLNSFGLAGILSNGFTFQYWETFFLNGEFLQSFTYSVIVTVLVIIISTIIALSTSIAYNGNINTGRSAYLFYIPLAIPFIVAGFLTYQLLNPTGFFSRVLIFLNIIDSLEAFPDLTNDKLNVGIIVAHVVIASTFFAILFANIFKNEKLKELANVAKGLGAKRATIYNQIYVPILLKKSNSSILLYSIFTLGSYEIPLLLGRQSPQFISVAIANKFQRYNLQDIPLAYCMAAIYTLLVIIILISLAKGNKLYNEK